MGLPASGGKGYKGRVRKGGGKKCFIIDFKLYILNAFKEKHLP